MERHFYVYLCLVEGNANMKTMIWKHGHGKSKA